MLVLLLILFLTVILAILLIFALYQAPKNQIGYIGLPKRVIPRVIEALGPTDGLVVDLGCGDGRILAAYLRRHSKTTGLAVEINPVVMTLARGRLRSFRSRVHYARGNLLEQDLHGAQRVFTYLNHPTMAALEAKLESELPSGARLVSCDFPLPNCKPTKKISVGHAWQLGQNLYIYDF